MAKMTSLLIRLEPELLAVIDRLRGEVPRVAYIRNRLAETVRQHDAKPERVRGGYVGPSSAPAELPTGGTSVQQPVRVEVPLYERKTVSRLKPDKGSKSE